MVAPAAPLLAAARRLRRTLGDGTDPLSVNSFPARTALNAKGLAV
jgi:hypothetical protein